MHHGSSGSDKIDKQIDDFQMNPSLEQVVAYDTTFDIGEFYLSSLVIKDTDLKDEKNLPSCIFSSQSQRYGNTNYFFDWLFNGLNSSLFLPFL